MALLFERLAQPQYIGSSAASVYANPASTTSYIKSFVIHNGNTATELIELWNVPNSGGSLGSTAKSNKFLTASLAANETLVFSVGPMPLTLEDTNDAIFAKTSTATQVSIQILGAIDQ